MFGLGQQNDAGTDLTRAALTMALLDDAADVRYEGVIVLGHRRDGRAVGDLPTQAPRRGSAKACRPSDRLPVQSAW